jgi:hypothetical protein
VRCSTSERSGVPPGDLRAKDNKHITRNTKLFSTPTVQEHDVRPPPFREKFSAFGDAIFSRLVVHIFTLELKRWAEGHSIRICLTHNPLGPKAAVHACRSLCSSIPL